MFMELFRHCSGTMNFAFINNLCNNSYKGTTIVLLYRRENWGIEKWNNMAKVLTKSRIKRGNRIWIHVVWLCRQSLPLAALSYGDEVGMDFRNLCFLFSMLLCGLYIYESLLFYSLSLAVLIQIQSTKRCSLY